MSGQMSGDRVELLKGWHETDRSAARFYIAVTDDGLERFIIDDLDNYGRGLLEAQMVGREWGLPVFDETPEGGGRRL